MNHNIDNSLTPACSARRPEEVNGATFTFLDRLFTECNPRACHNENNFFSRSGMLLCVSSLRGGSSEEIAIVCFAFERAKLRALDFDDERFIDGNKLC